MSANGRRANLPAAHPTLRIVEGDIRDLRAVDAAVRAATHMLHLAAQVSVQASVADPLRSRHHNVVGFVNVLECARAQGVPRVVYGSSAAVYGLPQGRPLTAVSPARALPRCCGPSDDPAGGALVTTIVSVRESSC